MISQISLLFFSRQITPVRWPLHIFLFLYITSRELWLLIVLSWYFSESFFFWIETILNPPTRMPSSKSQIVSQWQLYRSSLISSIFAYGLIILSVIEFVPIQIFFSTSWKITLILSPRLLISGSTGKVFISLIEFILSSSSTRVTPNQFPIHK